MRRALRKVLSLSLTIIHSPRICCPPKVLLSLPDRLAQQGINVRRRGFSETAEILGEEELLEVSDSAVSRSTPPPRVHVCPTVSHQGRGSSRTASAARTGPTCYRQRKHSFPFPRSLCARVCDDGYYASWRAISGFSMRILFVSPSVCGRIENITWNLGAC